MNTPSNLTRNEQLAALVKEIESSYTPVILSPAYVIELFDEVGFERWLGLYGYVYELVKHPSHDEAGNDRTYYHISKAQELNDDGEDEEL